VRLTVLYFAAAREAAGVAREVLDAAGPLTVRELRALLVARHAGLARVLPRCRVAGAEEMADDDQPVPDGAEIALIPPVAGGAPICPLVEAPLSLDEAVGAVRAPGRGAVVTF
jgi:molybdopterin synthase catalytic subunit